MVQGDITVSPFNVNSDLYGNSNVSGEHFSGRYPPAAFQILGVDTNPAQGSGGKGRTRMLIFAIER